MTLLNPVDHTFVVVLAQWNLTMFISFTYLRLLTELTRLSCLHLKRFVNVVNLMTMDLLLITRAGPQPQ